MNATSKWMWMVCGCIVAALALADVAQAQDRGGPGGGPPGGDRRSDAPRSDRGPGGDRRGGWGGDRRGGWGGQMEELTDEQREEAMAVFKDMNPERYERTQEWAKNNPQMADRMASMVYRQLKHLIEMKKNDPIHYRAIVKGRKLDGELRTLRQQIRAAQQAGDESKAEQLTIKLRDLLEERFEVQQTLDQKRLEQMKRDAEKLEEKIASDEAKKDEVIDERLAKYLSAEHDPEIDGWRRPQGGERGDRGPRGEGDRDERRDRWNRGGDRDAPRDAPRDRWGRGGDRDTDADKAESTEKTGRD